MSIIHRQYEGIQDYDRIRIRDMNWSGKDMFGRKSRERKYR